MSKKKTRKTAKPGSSFGSSSVEDTLESCLDQNVLLKIKKFEHDYVLSPITTSPFQFPPGIDNKFLTYESALEFITIHCFRIHGKFTREISRLYIP
jgi:hypothetical protein